MMMTTQPLALSRRAISVTRDESACTIALDRIRPDPNQPRKTFDADEITELSRSLTTHGQLQACIVRWDQSADSYFIVAGERRYRAAQQAGLPSLRCHVMGGDGPPDELAVREVQLIENSLRTDLPPLEQANAFQELMHRRGWTPKELAERLNINKTTVLRAVSLLDLPEEVREHVAAGRLSTRTAQQITTCPTAMQPLLAAEAIKNDLSAGDVIKAVKAIKASKTAATAAEAESKPGDEEITTKGRWVFIAASGTRVLVTGHKDRQGGVPEALREALAHLEASRSS